MLQVPSDPSIVVLFAEFEDLTPDQLFAYFTQPELLVKWWPPEAESDPRLGGKFLLRWPDNAWALGGEFTTFEPGRHLAFTCNWEHEADENQSQQVDVWIGSYLTEGSTVGLYHGKFGLEAKDQAARQGVAEGWIHFMMHLAGLTDGDVE